MSRFVDEAERRARLGRRHRLAPADIAASPLEVAQSLTAIHGTDPGSTMLGILSRSPDSTVPDVEHALFDDRTIIRVLGMRRTLFAIDWQLAPAVWMSSRPTVVREQVRLLGRMLEASGISDPDPWIAEAEARLIAFLDEHPGSTSAEIAAADPYLGYRVSMPGAGGGSQSVTSRLLTHMSAGGQVIRARPKGSWNSTQFTWVTASSWRSDWTSVASLEEASAMIARSWLLGHGPGTVDDFSWWAGWPKGRSRNAIVRAGAVEVRIDSGTAYLHESDLEPITDPEPWVALLPGLDSSTMGWKQRSFYLGPHVERLFDNVGNGGPTVWVDGRIVGGWSQLDSGSVVFELFEDVGTASQEAIEVRAAALEQFLGTVRLKLRARRWTASEIALRQRGK